MLIEGSFEAILRPRPGFPCCAVVPVCPGVDACCSAVAQTSALWGPAPGLRFQWQSSWQSSLAFNLRTLEALVGGSCILDFVQAATTEFRLHYVLIQMAGFTMSLTLLNVLIVLGRTDGQQRLWTASWTFAALILDLLLVAALHNEWIRLSLSWTGLEYLGLVLYTADACKQSE